MGLLNNDEQFYYTELAKFQLKSSIGWMKLISIAGLLAAATLWFFDFEVVRKTLESEWNRFDEEEIIAVTIMSVAAGLLTAIFFFLLNTARHFSEFLKEGNPQTLQTALSKQKTMLILAGIFAILAGIGILFLLGIYIDEVLMRDYRTF